MQGPEINLSAKDHLFPLEILIALTACPAAAYVSLFLGTILSFLQIPQQHRRMVRLRDGLLFLGGLLIADVWWLASDLHSIGTGPFSISNPAPVIASLIVAFWFIGVLLGFVARKIWTWKERKWKPS